MRHLPLAANDKVEPAAEVPIWIEGLKAGPPTEQDEQLRQKLVPGIRELVADDRANGLTSYEFLEVLGKGGMGVVYRCRHRQLGRLVAVKVVRPKLVLAAEAQRRFDREIQILGGLNHPGIVMATDAGRIGHAAFLVMELINGVDLSRLVRSRGPLNAGEACEVARQIAVALSAAHAAGAVHRDVKPSNVMINISGQIKLLDFGLACLVELGGERGETSLGQVIGTLDYMAPEQSEGMHVQPSADLYGLGATLFYLLVGRPPHANIHNRTLLSQLKALSCEAPQHLSELRVDVPRELSNLVAKLLARNPADRPNNAADVADHLATWADSNSRTELAKLIPTVDRSDNVKAAAYSLAELVGPELGGTTSEPILKVQAVGNGGKRRIRRWISTIAGFAAVVLGIVLLIDTPEGTLRIESEANSVQVELVDDADHAQTVEIDEGENHARLRVGKYRIRLAGVHDNLTLTPGAIELRQGEEQLVNITRLPLAVPKNQNLGRESKPDEAEIRAPSEELTLVTIPVEYEDGSPATGAELTLRMNGETNRPVVVTDKADAHGLAVNRRLPYGKYEMTIKVADGTAQWSVIVPEILLEFGGSYRQKVVAPTPALRATAKVHTTFSPAGLKDLKFGKLVFGEGHSFIRSIWAPGPDKEDKRFTDFPVLGDGISEVAVLVTMTVTRNIKQPDGATLDWRWARKRDFNSDYLFVTEESVIDFQELGWDVNVVNEFQRSKYFRNVPAGYGVQYVAFPTWHRSQKSLSLELPSGKLGCEVRAFYGKATGEVIHALNLKPEAERGIWLEAVLNAKSAWVPLGIDLSNWNLNNDINISLAYKTLSLEPGITQTVRIASPTPLRADDGRTKDDK